MTGSPLSAALFAAVLAAAGAGAAGAAAAQESLEDTYRRICADPAAASGEACVALRQAMAAKVDARRKQQAAPPPSPPRAAAAAGGKGWFCGAFDAEYGRFFRSEAFRSPQPAARVSAQWTQRLKQQAGLAAPQSAFCTSADALDAAEARRTEATAKLTADGAVTVEVEFMRASLTTPSPAALAPDRREALAAAAAAEAEERRRARAEAEARAKAEAEARAAAETDTLNAEVRRRNAEIDARNKAAEAAYQKAQADHKAAVAARQAAVAAQKAAADRTRAEAEQARRTYDAEVQRWRQRVEACNKGQRDQCGAPQTGAR